MNSRVYSFPPSINPAVCSQVAQPDWTERRRRPSVLCPPTTAKTFFNNFVDDDLSKRLLSLGLDSTAKKTNA